MIDDWIDFIGVLALSFLIILFGVWMLPQLPEKNHLIVAISILLSSIFFTRKMLYFIIDWFERRKIKRKRTGGKSK